MRNLRFMLCALAASLLGNLSPLHAKNSRFFDQSAMSSSQLTSIVQDRQGYLWIGSNYGLMRFDGNAFKTWTHTDNNVNSIADNRVLKVQVANDNTIYIATANGMQTYNPATHIFSLLTLPDLDFNGYISDICQCADGSLLCVVSGVGIYSYRKSEGKLSPTLPAIKKLSWLNRLNRVIEYAPKCFIFSGQQGEVAIVNKSGKIAEHKLCNAPINDLSKDSAGNLLLLSNNHIWRYNRNTGKFTELSYRGSGNIPQYKSLYCSKNGEVYISTSGAGIKQVSADVIVDSKKWANADADVAHSKLSAVYSDNAGNIWVGCTNKGLLMLQNEPNQFKYMSVEKLLSDNESYIQDLAYDNQGSLWCSIEDFGAYKITNNGQIVTRIATPLQINRMHRLSDGSMAAGINNNGIYIIDAQGSKMSQIAAIDGTYNITALTVDATGNIYAAIDGRGIAIVDAATHTTQWLCATDRNIMINNWIPALCVDSRNRLWIGHYSGLSCYDIAKKQFIKVNNDGLRQSVCNDIIAADNAVWIATGQGLLRYDAGSKKLDKYIYNNGLNDNAFVGIVADNSGNIWATSRTGICKFETATRKFTAFYGGNGLADNSYNRMAADAGSNRISLAGQGGITAFQPANIKATTINVTPVVTDISIKGQPIEMLITEKADMVVNDDSNQVKKISLDYTDNALSIALSTLDFRNARNVSYQYRLSKSSSWINTNVGDNVINITNLTPGNYKLQIRACENGVYSPVREIEIAVASPWFWSTWAKIIYLALILAVCWQIYVAMQRKRDNQIKEAKLQFFINISHEIRSPLTLILSPLEALMKQDFDDKTNNRLRTIHRNATRILSLVNQLLDIRKIDKGKMDIHCSETDLVPFINEFTEMFKPKAEEKQIALSFDAKVTSLNAWIDRNNFDKVLINLLSNAFKYTPNGGEVRMELSQSADNKAIIRVIDSGIGIDEKKTEKIFERFFQDSVKNAVDVPTGFGIGLNLCKLLVELHHGTIKAYNRTDAQGSCFEVAIPLGNAHLTRQEKSEEPTVSQRKIVADAASKADDNHKQQKNVRHRSNYRVLVVDDDKEIRDYLAEFFAAYYKVYTVANGDEAWQHILNSGADLVISDVNMPGMNGIQLLKNIKNNGNTNHIPVILLTANSDYANRKEGWEKGADAYLPKPFNGDELLAITDSLIENRITLKGRFSGAQSQEDKIDKIEVKSNDDVLMNKIVDMINNHIDDPNLNVEMLGQEVGISRAHLHRKMKDMIGVSPSDFIRTIRLRKACELLKETDNDVTQIAYSIGFTSQTHFSTAFKKFMGMSPSEYRLKQSGSAN